MVTVVEARAGVVHLQHPANTVDILVRTSSAPKWIELSANYPGDPGDERKRGRLLNNFFVVDECNDELIARGVLVILKVDRLIKCRRSCSRRVDRSLHVRAGPQTIAHLQLYVFGVREHPGEVPQHPPVYRRGQAERELALLVHPALTKAAATHLTGPAITRE